MWMRKETTQHSDSPTLNLNPDPGNRPMNMKVGKHSTRPKNKSFIFTAILAHVLREADSV